MVNQKAGVFLSGLALIVSTVGSAWSLEQKEADAIANERQAPSKFYSNIANQVVAYVNKIPERQREGVIVQSNVSAHGMYFDKQILIARKNDNIVTVDLVNGKKDIWYGINNRLCIDLKSDGLPDYYSVDGKEYAEMTRDIIFQCRLDLQATRQYLAWIIKEDTEKK